MNILITGGAGFLGTHVISKLIEQNDNLNTLFCLENKTPINIKHDKINIIKNINHDYKSLDTIIHLAGMVNHTYNQDETIFQVNVVSTLELITIASVYNARVILASSSGVMHCHKDLDIELKREDVVDESKYSEISSKWPYYRSKILAETYGFEKAYQLGVSFLALRPSMIFGPGDDKKRSTRHIVKYLEGKQPISTNGGIDFVDVRDVADAFIASIKIPTKYGAYNLTGTKMTISDFFNKLHGLTNIPPPRIYIPKSLLGPIKTLDIIQSMITDKEFLPDQVVVEMVQHFWQSDIQKAREELGFRVRDSKTTLKDTIDYIKQN